MPFKKRLQINGLQTIIRDLVDGHDIILPNYKLRQSRVDVLKTDLRRGVRNHVDFMIGYGTASYKVNAFLSEVNAQVERVEPPFWWSGMKNSEIEILFYGKDIADYKVSTEEDVVITRVVKTENPNYIFVSIETKNLQPQTLHFNFSKKNRVKFTQAYELKKRKENSAAREGFTSADVMYFTVYFHRGGGPPRQNR